MEVLPEARLTTNGAFPIQVVEPRTAEEQRIRAELIGDELEDAVDIAGGGESTIELGRRQIA